MELLIAVFILGFGFTFLIRYIFFASSNYMKASGNGFLKTILDKGNYGEYLTFNKLEELPGHNKLMTNLYIPKEDGTTTEIDLIMIAKTGIYVFESKNYSGWIFGDEKQKYWTQTLPNKQKNRFYNPIWQNKGHISALQAVLGIDDSLFSSFIIFSERCTLKKINIVSDNIKVVKREDLLPAIKKEIKRREKRISVEQIDYIHKLLQRYCLADAKLKQKHINDIKAKNAK